MELANLWIAVLLAWSATAQTAPDSAGKAGEHVAVAATTVQVYPGPGVDTYQSRLYSVEVLDGANWLSSYVYRYARTSNTLWHWGASPTVNFTTFGTNGLTTVRVSRPSGVISSVEVSPKSRNIPLQIADGQALLTLSQGDKAWITLNGDDANPLFVFADHLKPAIPSGATYFGPGVRDIAPATGNHYLASNNETIYVDGGAWLRGNIDTRGKTNVRIIGPGVLSGDLWTSEMVQSSPEFNELMEYAMVRGDWGASNAIVDGVTIVDSPTYNFYGGTHQARNVKLLSPWYYSTDGFQGVNSVDQSFAFVGDNVFFPIWAGIANDNITVTNSFAGTTGNAVFCGGFWGNPASGRYKSVVDNVDIKTYNSDAWVRFGSPLTPAVFQIWVDSGDSNHGYSNQTYRNIRVEGDLLAPLAMLKNMSYPWGPPHLLPPLGNSYNLVFSNVSLAGTQKHISEIKGLDANNGFHNVQFHNLKMGGTDVSPANFNNYFAVNNYVSGLSFRTAAHGDRK